MIEDDSDVEDLDDENDVICIENDDVDVNNEEKAASTLSNQPGSSKQWEIFSKSRRTGYIGAAVH